MAETEAPVSVVQTFRSEDAMITLPSKPRFNAPCNGCGVCCAETLCIIGLVVYGDVPAPCPALKIAPCGTRTLCSIVEKEKAAGLPPVVQAGLGIGFGCSMSDPDTTQAEIDEQTRIFSARARQMLPDQEFHEAAEDPRQHREAAAFMDRKRQRGVCADDT